MQLKIGFELDGKSFSGEFEVNESKDVTKALQSILFTLVREGVPMSNNQVMSLIWQQGESHGK